MRPYTDKAKKALGFANRLSSSMGCSYIGTEHILMGLLREGTGVAAEVLAANNVEPESLRSMIEELISTGAESTAVEERDGYTPKTREVLERAGELAERFGVTEDFVKKAVCLYVHGNLAAELYF